MMRPAPTVPAAAAKGRPRSPEPSVAVKNSGAAMRIAPLPCPPREIVTEVEDGRSRSRISAARRFEILKVLLQLPDPSVESRADPARTPNRPRRPALRGFEGSVTII